MANTKKVNKNDMTPEGKFRYNDRMAIEITEDTKHFKKGQVVEPHRIHAEAYIKAGFAKKTSKKAPKPVVLMMGDDK